METTTTLPLLDAQGKLIGELDAKETEDPITLDSLHSLILRHYSHNTRFLLARVTTAKQDTNPSSHYYHYYDAHALNKVLFRQKEDYLARLDVLDPSTNCVITEKIVYFQVKCQDQNLAQEILKRECQEESNEDKIDNSDSFAQQRRSSIEKVVSKAELAPTSHRASITHLKTGTTWTPPSMASHLLQGAKSMDSGLNTKTKTTRRQSIHSIVDVKQKTNHFSENTNTSANTNTNANTKSLSPIANATEKHYLLHKAAHTVSAAGLVKIGLMPFIRSDASLHSSKTILLSNPTLTELEAHPITTSNYPFVAVQIGTDDDYMNRESIRKVFEKNALTPNDNSLLIWESPNENEREYFHALLIHIQNHYEFIVKRHSTNTKILKLNVGVLLAIILIYSFTNQSNSLIHTFLIFCYLFSSLILFYVACYFLYSSYLKKKCYGQLLIIQEEYNHFMNMNLNINQTEQESEEFYQLQNEPIENENWRLEEVDEDENRNEME